MVNFGPLTAEIRWQVWDTLQISTVWASAKLCSIEQKAPPIFSRAAITLGIGPHFYLTSIMNIKWLLLLFTWHLSHLEINNMPFSGCNFSDDWKQATASLSDNLCSVPSSLPLFVMRVFIIMSTQHEEDSVLCEVVTALFQLFLHMSHIYRRRME